MSTIVKLAKKAKQILLGGKSRISGRNYMSLCRRVERVALTERVCAMTFDDGPCELPPAPWKNETDSLTGVLLDTLKEFGAHGTFDVIGFTGDNYPDEIGFEGSATWGGTRYDHYPNFELDEKGGAKSCGELLSRILAEGHEVSNHTYRHILFGRKDFVYNKRTHLTSMSEVLDDLRKLDKLMADEHDYKLTLARPPHYVDKIAPGLTAYDAYAIMRYQYMGASFDGAGWLPHPEGYDAEVEEMVTRMRDLLSANPDALAGQIIFQKDGYNMAGRSPVADGLRKQLELLKQAGYTVVPVRELMEKCQFSDIGHDHPAYEAAAGLAAMGRCVAYRDNTVRPDKILTKGELAMLLAPHREIIERTVKIETAGALAMEFSDVPRIHPYSSAILWAVRKGLLSISKGRFHPGEKVGDLLFDDVLALLGAGSSKLSGKIKRGDALQIIYRFETTKKSDARKNNRQNSI